MNYPNQMYQSTAMLDTGTRNEVIRSTYLLLALSLIPTAIGALIGINMSFMFLAKSPIMGTNYVVKFILTAALWLAADYATHSPA